MSWVGVMLLSGLLQLLAGFQLLVVKIKGGAIELYGADGREREGSRQ
jgi:hypothetical protein